MELIFFRQFSGEEPGVIYIYWFSFIEAVQFKGFWCKKANFVHKSTLKNKMELCWNLRPSTPTPTLPPPSTKYNNNKINTYIFEKILFWFEYTFQTILVIPLPLEVDRSIFFIIVDVCRHILRVKIKWCGTSILTYYSYFLQIISFQDKLVNSLHFCCR